MSNQDEMRTIYELWTQTEYLKIEIDRHYNQKLNLIKDCREFCYTLGEKSLTRLQLQKLLDEFKDDENYVQNRYSEMSKEIEELKKLIRKNREALSHYANRMGSGETARRAIEEIDKGLEKAEKIK